MDGLFEWMSNLIQNFGTQVATLLPTSPFKDFIESTGTFQFAGYLNWFFPVNSFLRIVTLWVGAIGIFYLYSIIMRWIKMIGD